MLGPELAAAQTLGERPVFTLNQLAEVTGSRATAYRGLARLRDAGFARQLKGGFFVLRSSFFQPYSLWNSLLPSLQALKQARYFGRSYNVHDFKLARQILKGFVTLDHRAYDLTGLQPPYTLSMYVDPLDAAVSAFRRHGFYEGTRGKVILLPRIGSFNNELQRVYLDCLAYGGRSTLDAIAIEILYGDKLDPRARGMFRSEDVLKVRDELRNEPGQRSS